MPCQPHHLSCIEITVVHPINSRVIMLIKCLSTKCPTIIALDSKWTPVNNSNANCCSNYIILPILSTIKPHRQSHLCIHCDPNRCLCCCPSIYLCLYVHSTDHNPFGERQWLNKLIPHSRCVSFAVHQPLHPLHSFAHQSMSSSHNIQYYFYSTRKLDCPSVLVSLRRRVVTVAHSTISRCPLHSQAPSRLPIPFHLSPPQHSPATPR